MPRRPDQAPPTRFARTLRGRLTAQADPAVKTGFERYFKGVTTFHGVRTPAVRALGKEAKVELAGWALPDLLQLGLELVESPFAEERHLGVLFLAREQRRLPEDFLATLEPVFDRAVREWGTCDHIAGRLLRPLLKRRPADRARIVRWSRAKGLWRQRAAAVAFVNEAKTGRYDREILEVVERAVHNPERFVQLGVGWVLRELFLAESGRPQVLAFLRAHYGEISREGLRYAIEKMPKALAAELLDEHAAARAGQRALKGRPAKAGAAAGRRARRGS